MIEATSQFWDAVLQQAQAQNIGEENLRQIKSAHILRALSRKSEFLEAAADVARTIHAVGDLLKRHRRNFLQPGACSEAERDRIEAEIGQYIKACTANIERLKSGIPSDTEAASGKAVVNATTIAHWHGVCLILSERLQLICRVFDHCRSVRYQQLQRQWQKRPTSQGVPDNRSTAATSSAPSWGQQPQQQQMQAQATADAENAALQQLLLSTSQDVNRIERSMREVATLNQMFSTQVVHQSEQIEQIYSQAVQTSINVTKGNRHLRQAIAYNAAARKYVLVLLLVASFGLLFADWFYSGSKPKV